MTKTNQVLFVIAALFASSVAHADPALDQARKELADLKTEAKSMSKVKLAEHALAYEGEIAVACTVSGTVIGLAGATEAIPTVILTLARDTKDILVGDPLDHSKTFVWTREAAATLTSEKSACGKAVRKFEIVHAEQQSREHLIDKALAWVSDQFKKHPETVELREVGHFETLSEKLGTLGGIVAHEANVKK